MAKWLLHSYLQVALDVPFSELGTRTRPVV